MKMQTVQLLASGRGTGKWPKLTSLLRDFICVYMKYHCDRKVCNEMKLLYNTDYAETSL